MDEREFNPSTDEMEKCAIIYRSHSSSFLYVCYHCGFSFDNIDCTLQHIESHFEFVKITVDELKPEQTESRFNDYQCADVVNSTENHHFQPQPEIVDIKTEVMETEDEDCALAADENKHIADPEADPIIESEKTHFPCKFCNSVFSSKFLCRSHVLRVHFNETILECEKCTKKFKRNLSFERHLREHIIRGEVSWSCTSDGIRKPFHAEWSDAEENINCKVSECQPKEANGTKEKRSENKSKTSSTAQPYKCHKCSETCSNVDDLKNHFKLHSTDELLQINRCKTCDKYFQTSFELRVHVLDVHFMTRILKCVTCSVEFPQDDEKEFEKHLRLHLQKNKVDWTDVYEGVCKQGNDLANSEEVVTCSNKQYPCESCTETFYIKYNLDQHQTVKHSKLRKWHCDQCDSIFTQLKCYYAHQLEHRRIGPIITETDQDVLLMNLKSCIEEQYVCDTEENNLMRYRCLACSNQFNSEYNVRRHVRESHVYKMFPKPNNPERSKATCSICGKKVSRKDSMKAHLLTHTDIKLYECSTCGKKLSTASGRTIHERLHTGEKPYQCYECGKRFFSSACLTAHRKRHDLSTYPCKICGRIFNVPSSYRRHVQTHRKDKSFECTVCFKSFNTRVYLSRHMFKHSEKKYQCKFCEDKFNTANGQRQHEKSKHNYDPSFT